MSAATIDRVDVDVLAGLEAAVNEVVGLSLDRHSDAEVIELWRRVEIVRNRLAVLDHAVIAQVQSRHLPYEYGQKKAAGLARQVLRVGITEANARVRAAEAAGPRTALTGETLPPIYTQVAAGQAAGSVSAAQAAIIVRTVDRLPDAVQAEVGEEVEAFLVEQAAILDTDCLRKAAQRVTDTLDPDGRFKDDAYRRKQRGFRITQRPDGSAYGEFEFTAELAEHALTAFDSLAAPKPEVEGVKDSRTVQQRRHDALLDVFTMVERAEQLPPANGVTATVILTFDAKDWAQGTGYATTSHGASIPTGEAKKWCDGDTRMIGVVLNSMKRIEAYSHLHRIYKENQRLAMNARDRGCTFPGCDAPPGWCEAHHVTDHADGCPTSTDHGVLACTYHHREQINQGWTATLINGVAEWIPPAWLDPTQTPRRNHMHDNPIATP